jgi:hypothetical protein
MRESRTYGFVRGVLGDQHPYRDRQPFLFELHTTLAMHALTRVQWPRRLSSHD